MKEIQKIFRLRKHWTKIGNFRRQSLKMNPPLAHTSQHTLLCGIFRWAPPLYVPLCVSVCVCPSVRLARIRILFMRFVLPPPVSAYCSSPLFLPFICSSNFHVLHFFVPLSQCPSVVRLQCPGFPMSQCPSVLMSLCISVLLSHYHMLSGNTDDRAV